MIAAAPRPPPTPSFARPTIARPAETLARVFAMKPLCLLAVLLAVPSLALADEKRTSFVREVLPVLTKAGCNQGACHGAQHGRGGFKQSLLGFDPVFDYAQLVQSAEGRRIVLSDPESSIVLQKPSLRMEHGGGERFKVHSREYERIKQWLEDGVPEPSPKDPEVTRLEIWPAHRIMVPAKSSNFSSRRRGKTGTRKM